MIIEQCHDPELLFGMYKELAEDECTDDPKTDEQYYENMKKFIHTTDKAFVFKENGNIIGYALIITDRNPLYMRHFFICRNERRKGYGTLAFKLLIEKLNTTVLDLDVYEWNESGRAFWSSLGFVPRAIMLRYGKKC